MSTSWLLLCAVARARADLVFDPSVERVIVNVGSNTQPSLSHDPQTVAIAVEPMVGCRIREQRNLHVLHASRRREQHLGVYAVVQQVWGKFVAGHGDGEG